MNKDTSARQTRPQDHPHEGGGIGSVIAAGVTGAALGATAMAFTDSKNRNTVKHAVGKMVDEVRKDSQQLKETLDQRRQQVTQQAQETRQQAEAKAEEVKEKVRQAAQQEQETMKKAQPSDK